MRAHVQNNKKKTLYFNFSSSSSKLLFSIFQFSNFFACLCFIDDLWNNKFNKLIKKTLKQNKEVYLIFDGKCWEIFPETNANVDQSSLKSIKNNYKMDFFVAVVFEEKNSFFQKKTNEYGLWTEWMIHFCINIFPFFFSLNFIYGIRIPAINEWWMKKNWFF